MHPILLIVLDGLGDRRHESLDWRTPLEAVKTPSLDLLATSGVTGLMWPLGPGRAPTSPLAHTVLFGYQPAEYPGRGLVEALGEGLAPEAGEVVVRASFARASREDDGTLMIAERPDPRLGQPVNDDIDLDGEFDGVRARFVHTGGAQGLLFLSCDEPLSADVTDADPLRAGVPARSVVAFAEASDREAASRTASALNSWMLEAHRRLAGRGLDLAVVKWAGSSAAIVPFERRTGLRGATLARGALYRGVGRFVGMDTPDRPPAENPGSAFERDLRDGIELLGKGYDFVHVHTKEPDEAGHRKDPAHKRDVVAALDAVLEMHLPALGSGELVVCVTADHQTPSSGSLYHSGGAVPLLITGGQAGRDGTMGFAEDVCEKGSLGHIHGRDLMPLLLDCADRSAFLGAERYTAEQCLGVARADQVLALRAVEQRGPSGRSDAPAPSGCAGEPPPQLDG